MITKIMRKIHFLINLELYRQYTFFSDSKKYLKEAFVKFSINYTTTNYVIYFQNLICNPTKNFNRTIQFQIIFSLQNLL